MRLHKVANACLCLCTLFFATHAWPGAFTARISNLLLYETGDLVYIYVEGGTQQRPACAGSNGDYLSFSMARPRARQYLAALMLAFATGKSVTFVTNGACVDQNVSDTLWFFQINKE
jgi:hypothetical protein